MSLAGWLDRILASVPPASGAVVMGTGIVSIGLSQDHRETLSRILLVIAAAAWLILGMLLVTRVLRHHRRTHRETRSPAALTGVAATAVLGARFTSLGWPAVGDALVVLATCLWLGLIVPVLRNWSTPTIGIAFMVTVATESLSVLSGTLAGFQHAPWPVYAALVPFVLGLVLYLVVLSRFDFRQLVSGHGDHWVTGGALAISTLAADRIAHTAHSLHLTGSSTTLKTIAVVLWALTMAWLPALLVTEVIRPRLGYDVRRWATVFPAGMYAACSFEVGRGANLPGITDFARVWIWLAVALWLVVFVAMARRAGQLARREHPVGAARIRELAPSSGPPET